MPCNGNAAEICGGANRLNMYGLDGSVNTTTSTATTSVTATTTSTASTFTATGWAYMGCYIDGVNGRIFNNQQADNPAMTIESCVNTCSGLGYSVAGMEYGGKSMRTFPSI
jgi:hypothetical protein